MSSWRWEPGNGYLEEPPARSPILQKACWLGKLRHPTVYNASSISRCEIQPSLPPTSLWMLETLLGKIVQRECPNGWRGRMTPAGERGGFSTLGLLVSGCCLHTPETPFPGSGFQGLGSLRFSHLPLKAQQQMGTIFYHGHLPELLKWLNLSASVEKKK